MLLPLAGQRENSQKYFDLPVSTRNLNDSNPCSSLGAINFQKWELFSGSRGKALRLEGPKARRLLGS